MHLKRVAIHQQANCFVTVVVVVVFFWFEYGSYFKRARLFLLTDLFLNSLCIKGGHSKKLAFLSSLIARKHLFRSPKLQPLSDVSTILKKIRLERSNFGGRHFETVLVARQCLCDVTPFDSKLAGSKKTCN